jgi:hypothetical protein
MTKLRAAVMLAVVMLLTGPADATTVNFAVNPALIGVVGSGDVDLFSPNLNGMALQGQALSLDLVLTDAVLARLFLPNPNQLVVVLNVPQTQARFRDLQAPRRQAFC